MKFTNGFWLVRDEFQADYVRDIYEVEERENELLAFAPYKQIQGRGDTLNIGMMTYTFTAPAKDILGIHMVNHAGNYVKSPSFELYGDLDKSPERKCEKASGKEKWTLKSGKLSLEFETGSPEMKFYGDGRELTCIKSKTTGMMHHKQGMNYLVSGLNLGVGELVYGLGERFTPMVKMARPWISGMRMAVQPVKFPIRIFRSIIRPKAMASLSIIRDVSASR